MGGKDGTVKMEGTKSGIDVSALPLRDGDKGERGELMEDSERL